MKIIQLGVQVSKMPNEQIRQNLLEKLSPPTVVSLLNEALKRNDKGVLDSIAKNPQYINDVSIANIVAGLIQKNPQYPAAATVTKIFMSSPQILEYDSVKRSILSTALVSPDIASAILLHQSTPNTLIDAIITHLQLNLCRKTNLENSPHLQNIIQKLKEGETWNNERSGLILMSRIVQNPQDKFITEIGKYDLSPALIESLFNSSNLYKAQNTQLRSNIENNKSPGVEINRMFDKFGPIDGDINFFSLSTITEIISPLIKIIQDPKYAQYTELIWNQIKRKMPNLIKNNGIFMEWEGESVAVVLLKAKPDLLPEIIDILKTANPNVRSTPIYSQILEMGLNNPQYKQKVLELPEEYFTGVDLSPKNVDIVRSHLYPHEKQQSQIADLEDLLGDNNSWYKYALAEEILKEAGWKENITGGLLAAIMMILGGMSLEAASQKTKIPKETIGRALMDNDKMTKAKEIFNKQRQPTEWLKQEITPSQDKIDKIDKIDIDDIVKAIMQHEGLIPKQTPFRITNPSMRNWSKIHGFQIDKTSPKPKGRENFIFLVNADDVPKAIKKQLLNYVNNPARYGLSSSPSLKDALKVFDQSGVKGKLNYMQKTLSELDVDKPLSDFFA